MDSIDVEQVFDIFREWRYSDSDIDFFVSKISYLKMVGVRFTLSTVFYDSRDSIYFVFYEKNDIFAMVFNDINVYVSNKFLIFCDNSVDWKEKLDKRLMEIQI